MSPPDLARATDRNLGSASRDKNALLTLIGRLEYLLAKMGIEVIYVPHKDADKYEAWCEIYGEEQDPEVSWNEFASSYICYRVAGEWLTKKVT